VVPWLAHCDRPSQPGYTRPAFLDCFAFAIPCQDKQETVESDMFAVMRLLGISQVHPYNRNPRNGAPAFTGEISC
jgi:hypothetical protein